MLCLKCKKEKPIDNFPYSKNKKRYSPCQECRNKSAKNWRNKNKDRVRELNILYRSQNLDKIKTLQKVYRENNKERRNEISRLWWHSTKDKRKLVSKAYRERCHKIIAEKKREYSLKNREKIRRKNLQWRRLNKAKINALNANRRSQKNMATPKWAKQHVVSLYYELAKLIELHIGKRVHVDHIYPLKSKYVCGLHCENNLRLMWAIDNIKKGSKVLENIPSWNGVKHGFTSIIYEN